MRAASHELGGAFRGDSGLASPDMYVACKKLEVDFLLGLGPNSRLKKTRRGTDSCEDLAGAS